MIKYRLICDREHEFDGWFADGAAFDAQKKDGLLVCAVCGSEKVSKAIMAPAVPKKANQQTDEAPIKIQQSNSQKTTQHSQLYKILNPKSHSAQARLFQTIISVIIILDSLIYINK